MDDPTIQTVAKDRNAILQKELVQWQEYAKHYDEYVVPLTCYQDNISQLKKFIRLYQLEDIETVCDLGAGTGIYISAMNKVIRNCHFTHVDSDRAMIEYAESRYVKEGVSASVEHVGIENLELIPNSLDLITAINVIYSLPEPQERLKQVYSYVKPGGYFFTIDFGRKQKPIDWTVYFFKEMLKREGLRQTIKSIPSAVSLFKRQAEAAEAQAHGEYWLHSTDSFAQALSDVGFKVHEHRSCYRGYADLAICQKP